MSETEMRDAGREHITRLFDETCISRAIVVHPSKEIETRAAFPQIEVVPFESLIWNA